MMQTDHRGRDRPLASEMDAVTDRADELETQAARQLRLAAEARAVAGPGDSQLEVIDGETGRELRADGGEDNTHARRVAEQLGKADTEDYLPTLHVGDHVTDREDDGDEDEDSATMLVVRTEPTTAEEAQAGDKTIAEHNPDYPADDAVINVVYPQRTDVNVDSLTEYGFPRSRLRLEEPIHTEEVSE